LVLEEKIRINVCSEVSMAREITFAVFRVLMPYGLVERNRWFRAGLANMQPMRKVFAAFSHLNGFSDVVTGSDRT